MNVLQIIYDSIDELNLDRLENEKIQKEEDTSIFGSNSILDSMGLVNLITIIEEKLEEKTGKFVSIVDERAMSMESSPFRTIKTLNNFITNLLNE
jgi:acyl carrier protein